MRDTVDAIDRLLSGASGKWDAPSLRLERYTGHWSGLGRLP